MTDLSELIERVKAATGPDRELDGDIAHAMSIVPDWCAAHRDANQRHVWTDGDRPLHAEQWIAPDVTASIDAALALVGRCLPGCIWTIETDACWIRVLTKDDVAEFQGHKTGMGGKWTPLAITLALLLALESQS